MMVVKTFDRAGWMDGTCVGCTNAGSSCVVVSNVLCAGSGA